MALIIFCIQQRSNQIILIARPLICKDLSKDIQLKIVNIHLSFEVLIYS